MTDSALHSEPTIVGGETFAGRYRLEVLLGRGAFGAVYRARDPVLDRVIALKVIQGTAVAAFGGAGRDAFLAEARTIARLDHQKRQTNERLMATTEPAEALRLHNEVAALTKQLAEAEDRWCLLQVEMGEAG